MTHDDVLLLLDEEGRITRWEHSAEELFGWSATEAVGRSAEALVRSLCTNSGKPREGCPDPGALLIKPALQDDSLVWRVLAAGDDATAQDAAVLRALFTRAPMELRVFDDQLQVVRASPPAGRQRDTPTGPSPGAPFSEVCGFAAAAEEAAVARGVLEAGKPVVNRLVQGAEGSAKLGRRVQSVSYLPIEDASGTVLGLVTLSADVSERERALGSQALLETVRTQMGRRLSLIDVCQELAQAVVPAFADTAAVELVDSAVRGEAPPAAPVGPGVLLRQAAVHGLRPASQVGAVHPLPAGTPFSHVLSDLQPRLVQVDTDCTWPAVDPARADIIEKSTVHSLIVAPLAIGDEILGMVSFYRRTPQEPFAQDDLAVASAVCAHAALCVDRARVYMNEWIIMSTVQRKILPGELTDQPSVELSCLHVPGEEGGGAWCDAIALPGARTALVVGDVAGEGIPAAITMGLLRTAVHTLAALDLQPDELLARLSDTTARLVAGRAALPPMDPLLHEPLTADCAIAIHDPVELTCTIARAGLPEPVVVLPDGTSSTLPVPPGPPLAAVDTAPFPATTISLPEGSTLAMGTTALAEEAMAPTGVLRPLLDDACNSPLSGVRDSVEHAYTRHGRTGETLLLLARTKTLPGERVMTCSLPAGPEAAPIARKAARRQLAAWGLDDETAFTNELIVSELVGNATRYGAPPLQLRLILDRMLTCEVSDAAPSAPHVKHARTIDESGRGLFIVASLAKQWGTRYTTPEGKIVWAEQSTGSLETS
ncbi:SpoIIE family protein phosphatase [Streptomyces sp. NPDC005708]|uniref:ATP-binding SpoIIE family protein phosphatase n=1 Tax=Streptomyces sp. NPDC005708 TaxID=3154564 RepID=UPI0033F32348